MNRILLVAGLVVAGASAQASFWSWALDGNTSAFSGGVDLVANPAATGTGGAGSITYEAATIGGQSATVARLTAAGFLGGTSANDPFFSLANPIGANGGGARSNQYTVLIDLFLPTSNWQSLLQTGSSHSTSAVDAGANANDGDWFMNTSNGLGISGNYSDPGNTLTVPIGSWTRLVLTIDQTTGNLGNDNTGYRSYVDGALQNIVQSPSNFALDGRYSLGSTFHFFADEDREIVDGLLVNNIALWNRALTAQEVQALGGATAQAVPEPMTMTVLALGALTALRRKRK